MGRECDFSTKTTEYISWERAESRTPLKEAHFLTRRPSMWLETDEERRKLDASTNRDGEVSRILQRSSMTAEHNETVNGLYSLLSPRSFKYALQCILREKQNLSIVSR